MQSRKRRQLHPDAPRFPIAMAKIAVATRQARVSHPLGVPSTLCIVLLHWWYKVIDQGFNIYSSQACLPFKGQISTKSANSLSQAVTMSHVVHVNPIAFVRFELWIIDVLGECIYDECLYWSMSTETIEADVEYKCDLCEERFSSASDALNHSQKNHPEFSENDNSDRGL